jgi:ABC-2 type transport system permease protein
MRIRNILAIARKDALDILLNKTTLSLLITPIILALLFFALGKLFGSHTTNALVYNPDKAGVVQVLTGAYPDLKITYANSPDEVTAAFGPDGSQKTTSYALGLVVPSGFDTSLRSGEHPQLNFYVDGSQISNTQRQLLLSALADYSRSVANPQPPASIIVATVNPPSSSHNALQDISQIYAATVLLTSFIVGTSLVPGLLAEEKERKTLRMLMVSPASFSDVIAGKLLVGLAYQLLLAALVLTINGGFIGQVPLVLLFAVLGSCFSVMVGLLLGSFFQTTSSAGAAAGMMSLVYIIPIFFVGVFGQVFGNNSFVSVVKVLPTYYIADGVVNAIQGQSTPGSTLLDVSVVLGCAVLLFLVASWLLRRQAAVASTI